MLDSHEWPSDMPDDRRVIAVLGMVQILEEGMDKIDVLLKCLPDAPFKEHLAEEIGKKDAEIARLNQQVTLMSGIFSREEELNAELDERARLLLESTQAGCKLADEVERLTALVAMQSDVLRMHDSWHKEYDDRDGYPKSEMQIITESALSATAETVSAWQNEVKAKALEEAAELAIQWGNARQDDAGGNALRNFASELRAKGE